jgi:predicted O-linked N-acetylglucosamine transferase (SPINDLY family)
VSGCGLADLVARSFEEYSEIAVRLAANSRRLVELRRGMRSLLRDNDFGNPRSLARALEDAYSSMISRRWNGTFRPPEDFDGRNI